MTERETASLTYATFTPVWQDLTLFQYISPWATLCLQLRHSIEPHQPLGYTLTTAETFNRTTQPLGYTLTTAETFNRTTSAPGLHFDYSWDIQLNHISPWATLWLQLRHSIEPHQPLGYTLTTAETFNRTTQPLGYTLTTAETFNRTTSAPGLHFDYSWDIQLNHISPWATLWLQLRHSIITERNKESNAGGDLHQHQWYIIQLC